MISLRGCALCIFKCKIKNNAYFGFSVLGILRGCSCCDDEFLDSEYDLLLDVAWLDAYVDNTLTLRFVSGAHIKNSCSRGKSALVGSATHQK